MIVVELIVAVTTVCATVLPASGVIGRNALVGIRIRALMHDDDAWKRGHRAAIAPASIAAAIAITLGAVFVATGRTNDTGSVLLCALPIVVGAIWGAVVAARAVR